MACVAGSPSTQDAEQIAGLVYVEIRCVSEIETSGNKISPIQGWARLASRDCECCAEWLEGQPVPVPSVIVSGTYAGPSFCSARVCGHKFSVGPTCEECARRRSRVSSGCLIPGAQGIRIETCTLANVYTQSAQTIIVLLNLPAPTLLPAAILTILKSA